MLPIQIEESAVDAGARVYTWFNAKRWNLSKMSFWGKIPPSGIGNNGGRDMLCFLTERKFINKHPVHVNPLLYPAQSLEHGSPPPWSPTHLDLPGSRFRQVPQTQIHNPSTWLPLLKVHRPDPQPIYLGPGSHRSPTQIHNPFTWVPVLTGGPDMPIFTVHRDLISH